MTIMKNSISAEDSARIDKLRSLVRDDLSEYYDTDFNLLRWLQGHHTLPVEQIAKKLRFHLKLRSSQWDLDSMRGRPRTHPIHKHWCHGITGESGVLDNVIVNIEQCGSTDYNGMMECFSLSEVMKARVPDLEEMLGQVMELEKKTGRQASILFVMDITGLEYNRKLYDLVTGSMKALADFMADHYVELIKYFVPVCLPSFASAIYMVVRPLLPERTRQKVRLLSATHWKTELLEWADPSTLPAFWSDDEHTFPAKLDIPIKYPLKEYYSQKGLKPPPNTSSINVHAGKYHYSTYHLKENDVISWWVYGNRSMGFGFFRAEHEDQSDITEMDQITPAFTGMPGPLLVPLEDTVTIEKSGIYKMWFSNASSWWSTLHVQCAVDIQSEN